jgi:hypothetical protein
MRQIDWIANEPSVRGVKLVLYWGALETSPGDYSAGYALIDQYLAKLKATNKYLILSVQDRLFGGHEPSTIAEYFPDYIIKTYGITRMANGMTLRVWQAPVMDREIALLKALGMRYNSHPNFEMIQVDETSIAVTNGVDGFSISAHGDQTKRLLAAIRPIWTHTLIRLPTNFFGSDKRMTDLLDYANKYRVAVGGPDVIPNQAIQADRVFMGGAGKDYRGVMAWVAEVQSPSLGGHEGTFSPRELYDSGMQRKPSHFVWYRNTWSGGAAQKWDTGILPFIRSIKGATVDACPTSFRGACSD